MAQHHLVKGHSLLQWMGLLATQCHLCLQVTRMASHDEIGLKIMQKLTFKNFLLILLKHEIWLSGADNQTLSYSSHFIVRTSAMAAFLHWYIQDKA